MPLQIDVDLMPSHLEFIFQLTPTQWRIVEIHSSLLPNTYCNAGNPRL